jgi:hypothetical protein
MPGPLGLDSLLAVRPFLSLTWLSEPQGIEAGGPADQVLDVKKKAGPVLYRRASRPAHVEKRV